MVRDKRLLVFLAVMIIVSMLASACGPRGEKLAEEISLNLGTEPPTGDPGLAEDSVSIQVAELLFLGLTDFDDETMEVIPELATEWKASEDGLVWTFTMRKDVNWVHYDPESGKFTKERPVNARDVEYGVKRTLDPATASPYAYVLYVLKNGEAFNVQEISDPAEVGVKAVGDYTVEFTLEQPAGYFPAIAGMWMARPVPSEAIDEHDAVWTEPGNIWTNGPYALDTWEHESKMVMVKNPHYYNAKTVSIEKINWVMVTEASTAFAMYENGELESVGVPSADMDRVMADPELSKEVNRAPELCTYYLGYNNSKPPVDNKLVRQALSYAVDRQKLIDTVTKGGQKPAKTFACPGIFGTPAEDPDFVGILFDPDKAKQLLAEAGYPNGEGLPEITYMFNTHEGHQRIAEFLQRGWKDTLGVEVQLANQEWKVYLKTTAEDAPQMFRMSWGAAYPDENNWVLEVFHSTKSTNHLKWKNEEFDRVCDEAATASYPDKRKELYFRAEQILCVDEAAIIPIYHHTHVVCTKPYVERTYAPLGGEHVDRWKVKEH